MRLTRQVLLIGALLAAAAAQPAKADCRLEPDVRFPAARESVAMQPITVTWSRCGTASEGGPPAFLIISLPDAVRLQGNGFFALRPGARAPLGIGFRRETLRVVVPLHLPTTAASGAVEITPLRAGAFSIEAGVVKRSEGAAGWTVASPSQTSIKIVPGAPELRVWQQASPRTPKAIRDSVDGRWELRIFDGDYEVIDRASGDLVLSRQGTAPTLSPTQRFLTAVVRGWPDAPVEVEVIDLDAAQVILDATGDAISWAGEDSFLIVDRGEYGKLELFQTLIGSSSFEQTGTVSFTNEYYAGMMKTARELGGQSQPDEPYGNDETGGVGVAFTVRNGTMTVTAVLPGTPAASADIRPGDIIGAVDGEPTQGMAPTEFRDIMRGPLKSVVRLRLARQGSEQPLEVDIVRDIIRSPERSRVFGGTGCHQCAGWDRSQIELNIDAGYALFWAKGGSPDDQQAIAEAAITGIFALTGDYSVTAEYDVGGRNLTSRATIDAAIRLFRDDPPSRPREWSFPSQLQLSRTSELTVDERMQAEQQRRLVTSSNIIFQPAEKRIVVGENAAQWKIRGAGQARFEQSPLRRASLARRLEDSWQRYDVSASVGEGGESHDLATWNGDEGQDIFRSKVPEVAAAVPESDAEFSALLFEVAPERANPSVLDVVRGYIGETAADDDLATELNGAFTFGGLQRTAGSSGHEVRFHPFNDYWEFDQDAAITVWPQNDRVIALHKFVALGSANGIEMTFLLLKSEAAGGWTFGLVRPGESLVPVRPDDRGEFPHVDLIDNRFVVFWWPAHRTFGVFEASTGKRVCFSNALRQTQLISDFMRVGAGFFAQLNSTGDIDVYECDAGRRVLAGAFIDDELVLYDDSGHYDGSDEAATLVQVRFPGVPGRQALSQYAGLVRRPGLVKEVLSGKELAPIRLGVPPALSLVRGAPDPTISAYVSSGSLAALRIYGDGVLAREVPLAGESQQLMLSDAWTTGAREALAVAVAEGGVTSAALSLPISKPSSGRRGRMFGLAVGVDNYRDRRLPTLGNAESDAEHLAQALSEADRIHAEVSVRALTGSELTPAGVLSELETVVKEAGPSDTIVFSYAGHGLEEGDLYLLLNGSDIDRLDATALRWSDIEARLSRSAAKVLVLLDACHSGVATPDAAVRHDAAIERLTDWSGAPVAILAASKGRERSLEAFGGGIFTDTFARIVTTDRDGSDLNGDGLIELSELYAGLKRDVLRLSGGRQTPWIGRRGLVGDLTLF